MEVVFAQGDFDFILFLILHQTNSAFLLICDFWGVCIQYQFDHFLLYLRLGTLGLVISIIPVYDLENGSKAILIEPPSLEIPEKIIEVVWVEEVVEKVLSLIALRPIFNLGPLRLLSLRYLKISNFLLNFFRHQLQDLALTQRTLDCIFPDL